MSERAAVGVTGIGVVSPFGWEPEAFWEGLVSGTTALRPAERFATVAPGRLVGEVAPRAVGEVARSAVGRRMDWASLMAVGACRAALADAGIDPAGLPADRTSLALGSAYGNLQETATFLDRLFARGAGNPLVFPNLVFNAPLAYASIELGIRGETAMFSMLEASGEVAIGWGIDALAAGRATLCLAGGVDELGQVLHRVLEDGRRLAAGVPRPFAVDADGMAAGEGAAVLVLERLSDARARGARVYARVAACPSFAVPAPVHGWPRSAERLRAGLAAERASASAVFASACGDRPRDRLEAEALAADGRGPAVTAIRGAIGEFGAAGALAAAAAARAVCEGVLPPTLGIDGSPPGLDVVSGAARSASLRSVLVPGLARGGICRPLRFEPA
jgi:3-oxoacyl-[acyl-carrier-protein] synthase II